MAPPPAGNAGMGANTATDLCGAWSMRVGRVAGGADGNGGGGAAGVNGSAALRPDQKTAPRGFEPRLPDPESGVLPVTPRGKETVARYTSYVTRKSTPGHLRQRVTCDLQRAKWS